MQIAQISAVNTQHVSWMGTDYAITVDTRASAGLVGVFESVVPGWGGPPVHVHHNEDEVIHVIEEPYDFWLDGDIQRVSPGQSIFLPRGVPHTFRVASARKGRNLTMFTPAGLEGFFIEAGGRNLAIPADMAAVLELAGRHGIEFRGPVAWPV